MNKVVVLFSGGMDSATLLTSLREEGNEVFALGVNYNQKHRTELEYAQRFCAKMGIDYRIVDLSCLSYFLCGSSQTEPGIAVPEGHYEDESMKLTVVPNRNMILLSVAIGWAISLGAKQVAYAAHAGDHAIYPDCRKEFIEAFAVAARLCHYENGIELIAPFS